MEKELIIKLETEDLNPTQIRLLKTVNTLLTHVIFADDEAEFFDTSAELVKKVAEVIKHSHFPNKHKNIPYGDQAVEFSVDFLNEILDTKKLHNIDN